MRLLMAAAILAIAAPLFAQPSDILVYHDTYGGYGDAVITAINNLWPSCNVADHTGGEAGMTAFNTDLYSQDWDIIIAECWYYDTDDLDWMTLNDLYDTNVIYASCWEWDGGTSGQSDLYTSMGVSGVTTISSVMPHYAWQPSHPICDGITDWSWENPGLGTLNAKFTVSDADPVTGWTSSSQTGEAGICVANDGASVISGYTPGYAVMDVEIWTNILQFMADDEALVPATWGSIKANGIN